MEVELKCPQAFEIRAPRVFLILGLIILIIVIAITSIVGINIYLEKLDLNLGIVALCSQVLFLSMAILCLCKYKVDFFRYSNGEFFCKRFPLKSKTCKLDDVSYVIANTVRGGINIEFWDKYNKRIFIVNDDEGVIWKDGRLRTLLYSNNITLKGNVINY